MSYKRAAWHSGLTYQVTCNHCRTIVRYDDYKLGFRPWYADGFVYCPNCNAPLRHNESNAINPDGSRYYTQPVNSLGQPLNPVYNPGNPPQVIDMQQNQPVQPAQPAYQQPMQQQPAPQPEQTTAPEQQTEPLQAAQEPVQTTEAEQDKCPNCGRPYNKGEDHFCGGCGTKLD